MSEQALILDEKRRVLLQDLRKRFGVELLGYDNLSPGLYRSDVSVHGFFSGCDPEPTEQIKREIRQWIENQDWVFSRQYVEHPTDLGERIEYIYLAPMIAATIERGYHATRRISLPSIKEFGLLPGSPERQTTDRADCEGNIYLCEILGTPADAGVAGSKSAYWWCDHLAKSNWHDDPDWVILKVCVAKVAGIKLYRDIWSESGIIVRGVDVIPPGLICVL